MQTSVEISTLRTIVDSKVGTEISMPEDNILSSLSSTFGLCTSSCFPTLLLLSLRCVCDRESEGFKVLVKPTIE